MQLYFPRDQDVPSVEMLQKRLDSLREIPDIVEDDTNLTEGTKANDQSPMETQENDQSVSDVFKVAPSLQESSKESTQQDVSEQDSQLVDPDHDTGQHAEDNKSLLKEGKNTEEDNTEPSKEEEKPDTLVSKKEQKNDAALDQNQEDDIQSPETTQKDDSALSKSPNNIQSQHPASLNDDQLPSQKEDHQTDDTDAPALKETKTDDSQDVQQSSPMDTSSTDQSPKPPNGRKHSSEGEIQLPTLQKSVTGPASM